MNKKNPLPSKTMPNYFNIHLLYKDEEEEDRVDFEKVIAYELIQGKMFYMKFKDGIIEYINLDLIKRMFIISHYKNKK